MYEQLFLLVNGMALIWSVYLVGSDNPKGWGIGIAAEGTWLVWVVATGLWGLIPCAGGLLLMNIRGWWRHRKETKSLLKAWEKKVLSVPGAKHRVAVLTAEMKTESLSGSG